MRFSHERRKSTFRSPLIFPVLTALAVGCAPPRQTPFPLFPPEARPKSDASLATLGGDILKVDGEAVPDGHSYFSLLPGCHIVETRTSWNRTDYRGGVSASLPSIAYAIPMQPGHSYRVYVAQRQGVSLVRELRILAEERDAEGNLVQRHEPGRECP